MSQRFVAVGAAAKIFETRKLDEPEVRWAPRAIDMLDPRDPRVPPRELRATEIDAVVRPKPPRLHSVTSALSATSCSADRINRANHPPRASTSTGAPLSVTRPSSMTY